MLAPESALYREMELPAISAVAPLEVLRAATSTAAEALAKEDLLGSVEPGKFADFVIVAADPLESIQNLRQIHLVVEGGQT